MSEEGQWYFCVCDPEDQVNTHGRFCVCKTKNPILDMFGIDHDDETSKTDGHSIWMAIRRMSLFQLVVLGILGIAFIMYPYYSMSAFFVTEEYTTSLGSSPDIKREMEFKREKLLEEQERDRAKNQGVISDVIKSLSSVLTQNPSQEDIDKKRNEAIKVIDDLIDSQERIERLATHTAPVVAITTPLILLGCSYVTVAFLTYTTYHCKKLSTVKIHVSVFFLWCGMHIIGFCVSLASKAGGYESTRFILFILIVNVFELFMWINIKNKIDSFLTQQKIAKASGASKPTLSSSTTSK
jgi:hypothetical protein